MNEGERYISAKEVGDRVGLTPETILRYYREGRIPGRRLPGQIRPVRFLWSEVEAVWDCDRQLTLGDVA
jgi:predicted DNA-binding transcriptional regulator AlpA